MKQIKYYLNNNQQLAQSGGNYELHKEICPYYYNYKQDGNFAYIGTFYSDFEALLTAKRLFLEKTDKIDGCAHCCPSIHKK